MGHVVFTMVALAGAFIGAALVIAGVIARFRLRNGTRRSQLLATITATAGAVVNFLIVWVVLSLLISMREARPVTDAVPFQTVVKLLDPAGELGGTAVRAEQIVDGATVHRHMELRIPVSPGWVPPSLYTRSAGGSMTRVWHLHAPRWFSPAYSEKNRVWVQRHRNCETRVAHVEGSVVVLVHQTCGP